MRSLLNFIIRNGHWILAIILIAFSFFLVFSYNNFQRSVFLTSANSFNGWVYKTANGVGSFFGLKESNRQLLERNALLEKKLAYLESEVEQLLIDGGDEAAMIAGDSVSHSQFEYIAAEVVNSSFSGSNNFITLNRGSAAGIKPDMGVVSQNGVVGVVFKVSRNYSVVIPLINPKFRVSGKLRHSENNGSISWNGESITQVQLGELPKQEQFTVGDTVVTSYSRIFPKNRVIGYVSSQGRSQDDSFNTFNVDLATDFKRLQYVFVIKDRFFDEVRALEGEIGK
ncbi:MAG: rod shape-determining protein MreC [Fermentimonas sp.]|jgi:rod shape-determining protein MreC